VTPLLNELGFRPFGPTRKGKLPFRYWRERGGEIDMLEFQWDKNNRPHFVFNFRPVENERDIARLRSDPREWLGIYRGYFRAHAGMRLAEKWFGVSPVGRFTPDRAIRNRVDHACKRILEVDSFLRGGPPSPYLREIRIPYAKRPEEFFHPPSRRIER